MKVWLRNTNLGTRLVMSHSVLLLYQIILSVDDVD